MTCLALALVYLSCLPSNYSSSLVNVIVLSKRIYSCTSSPLWSPKDSPFLSKLLTISIVLFFLTFFIVGAKSSKNLGLDLLPSSSDSENFLCLLPIVLLLLWDYLGPFSSSLAFSPSKTLDTLSWSFRICLFTRLLSFKELQSFSQFSFYPSAYFFMVLFDPYVSCVELGFFNGLIYVSSLTLNSAH